MGATLELGREPSLSHSGIAGEENDLPLAAVGSEQGVLERTEFLLPADQDRTEDPLHGALILWAGAWWPDGKGCSHFGW